MLLELLTGLLDFLADAVFVSAPISRRTTRILVGILLLLAAILAVASWRVLWLLLTTRVIPPRGVPAAP